MTAAELWKINAHEYGDMINLGEGWRFAELVWSSVNPTDAAAPKSVNKVSATEFAKEAGVPNDRVLRHLKAAAKAADAGLLPRSMEPDDVGKVPLPSEVDHPWRTFYTGMSRHTADDRLKRAANADPAALVRQMKPKQRAAVVTQLFAEHPEDVTALPEQTRVDLVERLIDTGGINEEMAAGRAMRRVSNVDPEHQRELDRKAEERAKEDQRSNVFMRWMDVYAELGKARDALRKALAATHGGTVNFSDEERDHLQGEVAKTRKAMKAFLATLDLIELAATSGVDIDWDAEMHKMEEEYL